MTHTDPELSRYSLGDVVPPPYFFGVSPGVLAGAPDPFGSRGWLDHCRHLSRRIGIRSGHLLGDPAAPRWRLAMRSAFELLRSPSIAHQTLAEGGACPRQLLPAAALIQDIHARKGRVVVADIGGGFGDNFFRLLRVLRRPVIANLEYRIHDNGASCELGREIFSDYRVKPTFIADPAAGLGTPDIALLVGTLQYTPDWRSALASIAASTARYIYIARTPISSGEGFTTTQLVCPLFGPSARRNVGATIVNIPGIDELRATMPQGWSRMFEFRDLDYSAHFSRLPEKYRDVAYINVGWQREAGAAGSPAPSGAR